jgi:hypothetical protein
MQIILIIIAAIILGCSAALAQSPITFTKSGLVKLESLSVNDEKRDFVYGTADFGLRYSINDQFAIGADIGTNFVRYQEKSGGTNFATGVVQSPYGKLSVGIPRLVMPQVFDVPAIGGSEVLDVIEGKVAGEWLRYMTYFETGPTLRGIRYDGQFGKLAVAAAVQELGTRDRLTHAMAATYTLGNYSVSVGRADMDLIAAIATTTKIALRGHHGRISGGVVASAQEWMRYWQNTVNVFVGYEISQTVTANAQVFNVIRPTESYLAWGADVAYRHPTGVFLLAGVAQLKPEADHLANLSLGYQF